MSFVSRREIPKGPYTRHVAGLFQLAQTIVVGVPL
jgi:hypothetical protein